jgi:hypothetical protein
MSIINDDLIERSITFGLKVASTIAEYVPHTRIGWYGTGDQLRAYHTWRLIPATTTAPTARRMTEATGAVERDRRAGPRAVTTTPTARTRRSPGWTGPCGPRRAVQVIGRDDRRVAGDGSEPRC